LERKKPLFVLLIIQIAKRMFSEKVVSPVKTGVQCFYNYLELLDSLRARGPMGRRAAGVYPVLDTGPE
jgi:hypothetical protein